MKNMNTVAKPHRYFRRWVKRVLRMVNQPTCDHAVDFQRILDKLQDIEDMIEIIARQIARWTK